MRDWNQVRLLNTNDRISCPPVCVPEEFQLCSSAPIAPLARGWEVWCACSICPAREIMLPCTRTSAKENYLGLLCTLSCNPVLHGKHSKATARVLKFAHASSAWSVFAWQEEFKICCPENRMFAPQMVGIGVSSGCPGNSLRSGRQPTLWASMLASAIWLAVV